MKQKYLIPDIELIDAQMEDMIAASPGYGGTTDATEGNLSRQDDTNYGDLNVWDDDEE